MPSVVITARTRAVREQERIEGAVGRVAAQGVGIEFDDRKVRRQREARQNALQPDLEPGLSGLLLADPGRFVDRRRQRLVPGLERGDRLLARYDIGPVVGRLGLGQRSGDQYKKGNENAAHGARIHWSRIVAGTANG